jgi:hypothetical protein
VIISYPENRRTDHDAPGRMSAPRWRRAVLPAPLRTSPRAGAVFFVLALLLLVPPEGLAASAAAGSPPEGLPDAATLLRDVEARQNQLDKAREDYTFRATQTTRYLDKSGNPKKVETEEDEVFFVKGHRVEKLVSKNGKPLSPDRAKAEMEKVQKEVAKDVQEGARHPGNDDITVARLLAIVAFSHPRRVSLNGRDTIAFDFAGDPHAKTHSRSEAALKKVSGVIWIDEADHEVSRMSATLDDNYRVGLGLLASVAKGSNITFDQALIHNEAWLPTSIELHLQAKAFLVAGIRAEVSVRFDDYRKFQASAEQQPGVTVISK